LDKFESMALVNFRAGYRLGQSLAQFGSSTFGVRRLATQKKKEEKRPKRGASAFALFVKDKFKDYWKPGSAVTSATANVAAAWKQLPADQKQRYEESSNSQRTAQKKLQTAWDSVHKIPRPLTGYMRFINERRVAAGDKLKGRDAMLQFTKETAQEWRALPESKKESYNKAFESDMAKYNARPDVQRKRLEAKELKNERARKKRLMERRAHNRELRSQGIVVKRRKRPGTAAAAGTKTRKRRSTKTRTRAASAMGRGRPRSKKGSTKKRASAKPKRRMRA